MSLIEHQDNAGGQSWDTLLNLRKKIYWNAAANSTVHMHLEHPGLLLSGPLALFMLILLRVAIVEWVFQSGNCKVAGLTLDSPSLCVNVSLGDCRTSVQISPVIMRCRVVVVNRLQV